MVNPVNEAQSVQMAFPFVEKLSNIDYDNIKITADCKELPYEVYVGRTVNNYGNSIEDTKKDNFSFDEIINSISNDTYKAKGFTADEIGKLYSIEVRPTTDKLINFTIDFDYNKDKTKILIKNFNRYERNDGKIRIACGCFGPQTLELYVLGEDIDLNINGYSDGSLSEKTDLFTYEISEKAIEVKTYLLNYITNYYNTYDIDANFEHISDIKIYNLYASALDKIFVNNLGFCSEDDILSENHIELSKEEGNVYTAALEYLPDDDLSFTLYSKEKVTLLDKMKGQINRSFGYFAPIVIGVIILLIIIIGITILAKIKKDRKN